MSRFLGNVRQNGYVVSDMDAALKHWTEVLGVGPFYYIEHVQMDSFTFRGNPSDIDVSIALGNSGDLQVELICQRNDAPSTYLEFLKAHGPGMQHMSYWTHTYQVDYDRMLARGMTIGQEGQIGGPQGRFAYFDTETHGGTVLELSDISGAKGEFFEHIRREADGWDGTKPIRPVRRT